MTAPVTTSAFRREMRRIMKQQPDLWVGGYAYPGLAKALGLKPGEAVAGFAQLREDLLTEEHLRQFHNARRWLRRFPKAATFPPRRFTSYGLKHVMQYEECGYCTNGSFIAAALAEGFRAQQIAGNPNALLNIDKQIWDRGVYRGGVYPAGEEVEAYLESVTKDIPPWRIPEARQVLASRLAASPAPSNDDVDDTESHHWTYDHDTDQIQGSPWLQDG